MEGLAVAKTMWSIFSVSVALAVSSVAAAQTESDVSFKVSGRSFTATVPTGYCVPKGADLALAEAFAELDNQNFTHATFRQCGRPDGDYSLIKSQRIAEPITVTKPIFIAIMAKELESELIQQAMAQGIEDASKSMSESTGDWLSLKGGDARSAGFDQDCAYIIGKVEAAAGDETASLNFATCLTLIGERVFAVHSYSDTVGGVSVEMLKQRSRAIAATVKPVS